MRRKHIGVRIVCTGQFDACCDSAILGQAGQLENNCGSRCVVLIVKMIYSVGDIFFPLNRLYGGLRLLWRLADFVARRKKKLVKL